MNSVVLPERLRRFLWKARSYRYRRSLGTPVILLYHRVGDETTDPLLLSVSRQNFALQMEFLREHCHVLPLADFTERSLEGVLPENAVAISFDDGYLDNLTNAAPILAENGFQGTCFVATGRIDNPRAPWWDYLDRCLLLAETLPESLSLETPDGVMTFAIDGQAADSRGWTVEQPVTNGRQRAYLALQEAFLGWVPVQQAAVMSHLITWSGVAATVAPERAFMNAEELRRCEAGGVISLGGHTVNHPRVSLLSDAQLDEEIGGSRKVLADILGKQPELFAFPFGTFRDYGVRALKAVQRAGYKASFANMPAPCDGWSNRWELPRVLVRNWGPVEFAQRLGLD